MSRRRIAPLLLSSSSSSSSLSSLPPFCRGSVRNSSSDSATSNACSDSSSDSNSSDSNSSNSSNSSSDSSRNPLLLRHFIHDRLQDYFSQDSERVVGAGRSYVVPFWRLLGEGHWKRWLDTLYKNQSGQWLTPVEVFQPYYSQCLANAMVTQIQESDKDTAIIELIELGGGRGTNAQHILDYLKESNIEIYDRIRTYTLIDASPSLLQLQQDTLLHDQSSESHKSKLRFEQTDLIHVAEGRVPLRRRSSLNENNNNNGKQTNNKTIVVVIALEVLDNLAHDKLRIVPVPADADAVSSPDPSLSFQVEQAQVVVVASSAAELNQETGNSNHTNDTNQQPQQQFMEEFQPISDPLLKRILDIAPGTFLPNQYRQHMIPQNVVVVNNNNSISNNNNRRAAENSPTFVTWIPTVACGILQALLGPRGPLSNNNNKTSTVNEKEKDDNVDVVDDEEQDEDVIVFLADFDWLPPPEKEHYRPPFSASHHSRRSSVWGRGEPIVTDMEKFDYPCYLSAFNYTNNNNNNDNTNSNSNNNKNNTIQTQPQACDILFPTDFKQLVEFVQEICKLPATPPTTTNDVTSSSNNNNNNNNNDNENHPFLHVMVEKQSEFLYRHATQQQMKATQSYFTTYSPFLHDYANSSIMTIHHHSRHRRRGKKKTEETESK